MSKLTRIAAGAQVAWQAIRAIQDEPTFYPLTAPKVSLNFNGNMFSTVAASTLIDLVAECGLPPKCKAIIAYLACRDSGSGAGADNYFGVGPTATGWNCAFTSAAGFPNNIWCRHGPVVIPCGPDGNVYYRTLASGVNTLQVYFYIWGYWI